jgi:hypothetical protein
LVDTTGCTIDDGTLNRATTFLGARAKDDDVRGGPLHPTLPRTSIHASDLLTGRERLVVENIVHEKKEF